MDLVVRGRFGWAPFQPAGWVTFNAALNISALSLRTMYAEQACGALGSLRELHPLMEVNGERLRKAAMVVQVFFLRIQRS